MVDRADAVLEADNNSLAPATAPSGALTVEQFPGLCLGASLLVSLSLNKAGFGPLTEEEGKGLSAALLKNCEAWGLGAIAVQNPRAAAGLDLAGIGLAIFVPRIIGEIEKRIAAPRSPTQAAAAAASGVAPAAG